MYLYVYMYVYIHTCVCVCAHCFRLSSMRTLLVVVSSPVSNAHMTCGISTDLTVLNYSIESTGVTMQSIERVGNNVTDAAL